jgi:hypothetical protein
MLIGARLCGVICAARLNLFQDASIPKSYLTALRRHLDIDPYDTNVRVYHIRRYINTSLTTTIIV